MDALLNTLRGFGAVKLGLMAIVSIALIGAFSMIAMRIASPALAPLYSDLSPEDSAKIITELGKLGVPYDTATNGSQILVPAERTLRLRMTMAELGLPANGSVVGYEIFDKSETLGTSNFVMNVNMTRALEGELARTINAFNQVESARVHLMLPKRELFAKDRQDPSASVALKLRGGQELSKPETAAITHFVAAAVPGLRASRVTVVDSYGRLLARGDGQESTGAIAAAADEYRVNFENRTRDTLESMIEKVVGPGKVKVQVAADMNFDRETIDIEKYDPEGQVARSVQTTSETDASQDSEGKDSVSIANQQPAAAAGAGGSTSAKRNAEKTDETTNFEISKTTQKQVKESGTVKRLSVAVIVDGTYAEEGNNKTYIARKPEEIKMIEGIVKSSIIYDEKRGDVVKVENMQFTHLQEAQESLSFLGSFKHELEAILQTLIIAGVAILAIVVVLRPLIQHMMRMSTAHAEARGINPDGSGMMLGGPASSTQVIMRLPGMPGAPGGAGGGAGQNVIMQMSGGGGGGGTTTIVEEEDDTMINLDNIKGRVKAGSLKKVVDFVDKNPNESMNVMRQWMMRDTSL